MSPTRNCGSKPARWFTRVASFCWCSTRIATRSWTLCSKARASWQGACLPPWTFVRSSPSLFDCDSTCATGGVCRRPRLRFLRRRRTRGRVGDEPITELDKVLADDLQRTRKFVGGSFVQGCGTYLGNRRQLRQTERQAFQCLKAEHRMERVARLCNGSWKGRGECVCGWDHATRSCSVLGHRHLARCCLSGRSGLVARCARLTWVWCCTAGMIQRWRRSQAAVSGHGGGQLTPAVLRAHTSLGFPVNAFRTVLAATDSGGHWHQQVRAPLSAMLAASHRVGIHQRHLSPHWCPHHHLAVVEIGIEVTRSFGGGSRRIGERRRCCVRVYRRADPGAAARERR